MRRQAVVGHARSLQGFLPPRILAAETACALTYRNTTQHYQNSRPHRSVQRYQDAQRHRNMQRYQEAQRYRNMSAIGIRTYNVTGTRSAIGMHNAVRRRSATGTCSAAEICSAIRRRNATGTWALSERAMPSGLETLPEHATLSSRAKETARYTTEAVVEERSCRITGYASADDHPRSPHELPDPPRRVAESLSTTRSMRRPTRIGTTSRRSCASP